MSVPHLDTRVVDGESSLLFGPYAGFTPKFSKTWPLVSTFFRVDPVAQSDPHAAWWVCATSTCSKKYLASAKLLARPLPPKEGSAAAAPFLPDTRAAGGGGPPGPRGPKGNKKKPLGVYD